MWSKNDKRINELSKKFKESFLKTARAFGRMFPIIFGTILFISFVSSAIPKSFYLQFFGKNIFFDSLIGSLVGSISAGTPITSYIFGGEMLNKGVSLIAVTTFLVTWVTVGVVQFPAEAYLLGKKFAFWRNFSAFILSIVVAIMTVTIWRLI